MALPTAGETWRWLAAACVGAGVGLSAGHFTHSCPEAEITSAIREQAEKIRAQSRTLSGVLWQMRSLSAASGRTDSEPSAPDPSLATATELPTPTAEPREEACDCRPAAELLPSAEIDAAHQDAIEILDRVERSGFWRDEDRDTMREARALLPQSQLTEVMSRLAEDINSGTVKIDTSSGFPF